MKHQPSYKRAVIICHGKSEVQICKFIRMNLRLPIEIDSNHNGNSSVQIESLDRFFNRSYYQSASKFYSQYDSIKPPVKNQLDPAFKVFTWMDIDGCNDSMCKGYKQNLLFEDRWFHKHLHPIYCDPKLEDILTKAKIPFTKEKDKDKKQEYIKIFPTDPKYKTPNNLTDREQIEEFYRKLNRVPNQNLHELIGFCLDLEKQLRVDGLIHVPT